MILVAWMVHKTWPNCPGQCPLAREDETTKNKALIHDTLDWQSETSIFHPWQCAARGQLGEETSDIKNWSMFAHICKCADMADAAGRQEWANVLAGANEMSWRHRKRHWKFEADHTLEDPTKRRRLVDIAVASQTIELAKKFFANNTLQQILNDDGALGIFFQEKDFKKVCDHCSLTTETCDNANLLNLLNTSEWLKREAS